MSWEISLNLAMIGNFVAYEVIQNISTKNRVFQMSTHWITCNAIINYQILSRYSCHSESKASRRLRGQTTINTSQLRIIFVVSSYVSKCALFFVSNHFACLAFLRISAEKGLTTPKCRPYNAVLNFRLNEYQWLEGEHYK